ncbi:hypothetical protein L596_029412 [Steinernema carpocapsae]|uniref:Uncharacterized protein n=1 Tax=Steinernema carpocapsae TaxID=34508 RepID=A0A4U5LUK8_STECR|nr:hypothetical protein L596_029412 [Steinernema carpocapsae]
MLFTPENTSNLTEYAVSNLLFQIRIVLRALISRKLHGKELQHILWVDGHVSRKTTDSSRRNEQTADETHFAGLDRSRFSIRREPFQPGARLLSGRFSRSIHALLGTLDLASADKTHIFRNQRVEIYVLTNFQLNLRLTLRDVLL